MKQPTWFDDGQNKQAAPAQSGGSQTQLDGRCFRGERGGLAVALQPASLAQLRQTAGATHWLIPVESVAMVHAAAALPGEVLWLCRRQPSEVLGQLQETMRGAWREGDAVVVNLDGQPQRVALPVAPAGQDALLLLAEMVTNLWTSTPAAASHGQPIVFNQPQPALLAAA